MATRVEKILSNARLTLADPQQQRWDDPTLIAILNEAIVDFCQQTRMLHDRVDVPIVIGNPYFSLPDDCWQLTRVLYKQSLIPLVSHQELDNLTLSNRQVDFGLTSSGTDWEATKGEPQAVLYDRRNMLEGKIYPIPDTPMDSVDYTLANALSETILGTELFGVTTNYDVCANTDLNDLLGVVSSVADVTMPTSLVNDFGVQSAFTEVDEFAPVDSVYGVIADISEYTFNQPYGTIVAINDSDVVDTIEGTYGFIDSMVESCAFIRCYYMKNPAEVDTVDSDITTPAMYDIALKFYVCGQALMNDIDAGYQQKGGTQMMQYERHVTNAKKDSARDFTRAGQFETTYRRGI